MTTNFDYLKNEPRFSTFADIAISAEKIILMDSYLWTLRLVY